MSPADKPQEPAHQPGPEEFMNDAQLADHYEAEAAKLADDDPGKAEAVAKAKRHRIAASVTAAA